VTAKGSATGEAALVSSILSGALPFVESARAYPAEMVAQWRIMKKTIQTN